MGFLNMLSIAARRGDRYICYRLHSTAAPAIRINGIQLAEKWGYLQVYCEEAYVIFKGSRVRTL